MALIENRDRSMMYASLQDSSRMAASRANARKIYTSSKNSTVLERRNIQRHEQRVNDAVGLADTIISSIGKMVGVGMGDLTPIVGKEINSLIQTSQKQQANAELYPLLTEGARIAQESLVNGESRYEQIDIYDNDGNVTRSETVFMPGDSLRKWYDSSLKKIDEMGFLPNIKNELKASLSSSYYGQVMDLQSKAIEKAYTDMQEAYATNLNNALAQDAAIYNQYDGDPLSSGITYGGLAIIAGRSDLSDEAKRTEAVNYVNQVRKLAVQEKATELARSSGGMAAVDEYLSKQTFLQPTERNAYYQIARTSLAQMNEAYTDQGSQMMEEAFTDGSSMPLQVYTAIDDMAKAGGLGESAVSALKDGAMDVQRQMVRDMADNSLASDMQAGYQALLDGYDYINEGKADAYLYGLPEAEANAIKANILSNYQTAIDDYEKTAAESLGKSVEDIRKADKELLSSFTASKTALDNAFLGNEISGRQYAQSLRLNMEATLGAMGEEGGTSWNNVIASYESGMKAISESEMLKPYKTDIEDAVEAVLVSEGLIAYSAKDRKKEEWDRFYATLDDTNGLLFDLVMDYGTGKLDRESFFRAADRANQAFVLAEDIVSEDAIETDGSQTYKQIVQNAVSFSNKSYAGSSSQLPLMRSVETYAADGSSVMSIEYPTAEFEAEYHDTEDVFKTLVSKMEGVPRESITCSPQVNEATGTLIASPVASVVFGDGKEPASYRMFGNTIQRRYDVGNGHMAWIDYADINGGYPRKFDDMAIESKKEKAMEAIESGQTSLDVTKYIHMEGGRWIVDNAIFDDPFYDYNTAYRQIRNSADYRGEWDVVLSAFSNAATMNEVR